MNKFQLQTIDDIAVVKARLAVATNQDAILLWDELERNSTFEMNKVIIDLSQCKYLSSAFIGMINRINEKVLDRNGQMKLVFPETIVLESLRKESIKKIVESFNSFENAYSSLNGKNGSYKIALG